MHEVVFQHHVSKIFINEYNNLSELRSRKMEVIQAFMIFVACNFVFPPFNLNECCCHFEILISEGLERLKDSLCMVGQNYTMNHLV